MRGIRFLIFIVFVLLCDDAASQVFAQPGFSASNIGSGWSQPIGAAFSKDGQKLFVWEKAGKVFVCIRNGSGLYDKQATPVIDLTYEVANWDDHGLTGFALDPDFAANGFIYLLYVVDRRFLMNDGTIPIDKERVATIGRLTRYQTIVDAGDLVADTLTRLVLLGETKSTGIPVLHDSHGMGSLVFAADGSLLLSAGDGATYNGADVGNNGQTYYVQALADGIIRGQENVGAFRSQMLNSHNGKILRIDPQTGNGLSSNPFYDASAVRSPKSRVWALGFRNPFRFTIRPGTGSTNPSAGDIGEIFLGDVGFRTFEELDIIKSPGMNCGWPIFEGHTFEVPPSGGELAYSAYDTLNRDEPNPLFNGGSCTPRWFRFRDLIKQATADGIKNVYNPCNPAEVITSGNTNRFYHRRPAIDWQQFENVSRLPIFTGNLAATAMLGTPASNATGTPFPGNCSLGGFWYTGNLFPTQFRNVYFHGDFGAKWIKAFTVNFTDVVQKVDNFASNIPALVFMTENPLDGTILYVDIGVNAVKRITYGGNQSPVVKMTSDVTYGPSSLTVSFTGNESYDPDGASVTHLWNFGDASPTSTAADVVHTFTSPAGVPKKFVVTLSVQDASSVTVTDSIIISVNNTPPQVEITSPIDNSFYALGSDSVYAFTSTVVDAEHSSSQLRYEWQKSLRHNNHEHPGAIDTARITSGAIARIGCNGESYYWFVRLRVIDGAGLSSIDSVKIFPACSSGPLPLVLRSFSVSPQGSENLVRWVTESAMEVKSFDVERSTDGRHFVSINHQNANASAGINQYKFSDNNFPPGTNYYRLSMTEIGDVIKYSAIVKLTSDRQSESLVISPNPVVGNFSVKYVATVNGPVTLRVIDISGKVLKTLNETVNRGHNLIYVQNEPTWKAGIYILTIHQGNEIRQGKLVKAE
ncbi:MAG: PQQ-dependent sugar dehydrogenase [Chitinophagaceae bacterium]|nr:PQQ-dependent sugar dehydrogenase [Chitinophagaceae bacterium]